MNKYTCKYDKVKVKDYCCIRHFLESIIEELFDMDDKYATTIVAKGDLAQDLIRLLLSMTMEDDDDFVFNMGIINFNSIDYDKEYYVSFTTNHEVLCCPAYRDDEYGKGYLKDEVDFTYIYEDCDYKILDNIGSDKITIFGFEEDND